MRRKLIAIGLLLLGGGIVLAVTGRAQARLAVGQLAPNFSLLGSDGHVYTLSHYRGKSAVVLAWFPKAFTSG